MKTIGEELKSSREESGLSVEEVAEDLKLSVSDIQNMEDGNKSAFTDNYALKKYIYDYAKYLGLDYEHLVEEFNEFMFTYTSKIPVDVIERISKQKEIEEANKDALSPYTSKKDGNCKKKTLIILLILLVIVSAVVVTIVIKNKASKENDPLVALV